MLNLPRTVALAMVAAASMAGAQATARVPVSTSKLWIEGTSNVHDWKCDAKEIDAAIDIDAQAAHLSAAVPKMLKKVSVKVPVSSLKCGHDKMDDNLRKALKADKNSEISYIMATFEAVPGDTKDAFTIRTVGKLTIAGVENTINMDVAGTRMADGTVKAIGTVPVKMTAFGVKPPTAMLGTIKTGDEVKVRFELTVGPKVIAAAIEK